MTDEEKQTATKLLMDTHLVGKVVYTQATGMDVEELARFVGVLSAASAIGTEMIRRAKDPVEVSVQLGGRILTVGNLFLEVGKGNDPLGGPHE